MVRGPGSSRAVTARNAIAVARRSCVRLDIRTIIRETASRHGLLILALAASLGVKILLLGIQAVPFNADEAVVALMAKHILQGERPLFFYGQAYMGSLD